MKKVFLMSILCLGVFAFAHAQGTQGGNSERMQMDPSQVIESRVTSLTESLSLTSAQVIAVKAIYEKTLGSDIGNQTREEASTTRHNEIMALLDADQKKIYEAYLAERSQRGTRGSSQGGTRGQMDPTQIIESRVTSLTESLSLTSDQVKKVKAIYEKTLGSQMGSQASSESMTDEERQARRDQMEASSTLRHNEIMALLNADQKKIYEAYLEER